MLQNSSQTVLRNRILMRVLHKHAPHHPLLSFPRVKSEFTLGKPWVYPTQTPSLLSPIRKCINIQSFILSPIHRPLIMAVDKARPTD